MPSWSWPTRQYSSECNILAKSSSRWNLFGFKDVRKSNESGSNPFSAFTYQPRVCLNRAEGSCQRLSSKLPFHHSRDRRLPTFNVCKERRNRTHRLTFRMSTAITELSESHLLLLPAVVSSYSLSTSLLLHEIGQVRYKIYSAWTMESLSWVESTNESVQWMRNHQRQDSSEARRWKVNGNCPHCKRQDTFVPKKSPFSSSTEEGSIKWSVFGGTTPSQVQVRSRHPRSN